MVKEKASFSFALFWNDNSFCLQSKQASVRKPVSFYSVVMNRILYWCVIESQTAPVTTPVGEKALQR